MAVTKWTTPPISLARAEGAKVWRSYKRKSRNVYPSTTRLKMRFSQAAATRDLIASVIEREVMGRGLPPALDKVETMASEAEKQRFRSFSERYVVERAATFTNDDLEGLKDAHKAVVQSRKVYELIASVAETLHAPVESANQAAGQSVQQGPSSGPPNGPTSQAMTQQQLQSAANWRQRMAATITGKKTP